MPRLDPHSPSAFNPADYTWVGYSDDGDSKCGPLRDGILFPPVDAPGAVELRAEANPSGRRNQIHPGGCDACGQMGLRYRHYFRHDPTGDVIVLGDQCVAKTDFPSREAHAAAKKVRAEREAAEMREKATEWAAANESAAQFLAAVVDGTINVGRSGDFLRDLNAKLVMYGSLSEKQTEAILKVQARQAEFEAKRAAEPTPVAIPADVLDGRCTLTGEVLTAKWKDSQFGGAWKMLVREDRGFKVWGTCPKGLTPEVDLNVDDLKGARVSFDARVEASQEDRAFGFYSRPTKAALVGEQG